MQAAESEGEVASELVLSYRLLGETSGSWGSPNRTWIEKQLTTESFRKQLLRSHGGPVTVGDEWEELLPCGCAQPQDVVLRVAAVHGGDRFHESTDLAVQPA